MTRRLPSAIGLVETVGALLILIGLWRVYSLFMSNGYLGPPFVFDVGDTFMDWFNTAYYAHNGHAYDIWRTIYLPLSFVVTGLFGDPTCYDRAPYDARDCDVFGIYFILFMYVVCVVVTALSLWRQDRSTAVQRSIAIAAGGPLLYALERGQLIMLTYIAFVLLYGGLLRSRKWFVATAAFMANTKVYMVFPLLALPIKRDWRLFEYCALGALALYLVTILIVGAGHAVRTHRQSGELVRRTARHGVGRDALHHDLQAVVAIGRLSIPGCATTSTSAGSMRASSSSKAMC